MHTRLLVALPLLVVSAGCADVDLAPPTGHDDVVLRIERSAGMGSRESFFVDTPDLVVTGDGTAYRSGEDGVVTYRISATTSGTCSATRSAPVSSTSRPVTGAHRA